MEIELDELIVDDELRTLIPPLTVEEYNQLEQNILEDDIVREPLVIWQDHNIIIDGYNRYKIIKEHPYLKFTVLPMVFESKNDVIAWMCSNQLGRRNISDVQRTILIGRAYEAKREAMRELLLKNQKRDEHGLFAGKVHSELSRKEFSDQHNISETDVHRSMKFVQGMDEIEKSYPGTAQRIQTGELEVTKKDVMLVTKLTGEDKEKAIDGIVAGRRIFTEITSQPKAEYTIEDFISELSRKADMLDKTLELTCILTHKDMLKTDEGKEALQTVLLQMTEIIKKYFAYCN